MRRLLKLSREGHQMLRRVSFGLVCIVVLLIAGSTAYYGYEVYKARADTAAVVKAAFEKHSRHVTLGDIPPSWLDILLKVEDPKFRTHRGVDLATPGAGMTTITQGLVKLLYFPGGFRPGIAKIRQTLIAAYALDDLVSKDRQLELYFNMTYFGSVDDKPIHGLRAAAAAYFRKPFRALTDDEFVALIGMTISPNTLKPGTAESAQRVARIEKYLAGETTPGSVLDVQYIGKPHGTVLEETLMAFLRLVTYANPDEVDQSQRPKHVSSP